MRSKTSVKELRKSSPSRTLNVRRIMQCLCSGEKMRVKELFHMSELPVQDQPKPDICNIEEAESSLREGAGLCPEEASALLGRYEYQKGNIEVALHVFTGIDMTSVSPKIKVTLARMRDHSRRNSRNDYAPPMSISAASLILEAMFLKAKSLQSLGRFKEAAQSCKIIPDLVESSLPDGLPAKFGAGLKLQETVTKAVELLPELWKLADCPHDAILSYRRALLHCWNLEPQTAARIEKEFAIYLLYSGADASPPNLRSQKDSSFVPQNNTEEAILLLMLLLKKVNKRVIEWDPSVVDHLSFAFSVSNQPQALALVLEELAPGSIEKIDFYHTLALCYHANGDSFAALNLLRKLLHHSVDPNHIPGLLLASEICTENINLIEEGIGYARSALVFKEDGCRHIAGRISFLMGRLLSEFADLAIADSERVKRQVEAVQALEYAANLTNLRDTTIVYHLSLQYAMQRKLHAALNVAKHLVKLEGGTNVKGLHLLARILSGQKRFVDAENIIDAALDQTGKWEHGELLRTKAKLQNAQGLLKKAIETYTQLLAILQVKSKSSGSAKKPKTLDQQLELETWFDLASIYINLSQWNDAEVCLSKANAIYPICASRWHTLGLFHEAKGFYKEALEAFTMALNIDPSHVPSLISCASVLIRLNSKCYAVIRSFLMNALKCDRTNHVAWYNLGLLCKSDNESSFSEAIECFETAAFLEETAPVEPFR